MWVRRIGGRAYLYESGREGGRVRSTCLGSLSADLAALMQAESDREAEERRKAAAARRAELEQLHREDDEAATLYARVETIAREALEAAGFHRKNRGPWRKRRMSESTTTITVPKRVPGDDILSEAAAMARDLVALSVAALLAEPSDGSRGRKHFHKCLVDLRATADGLAGDDPPPIVRIMADRAAFCVFDAERWDANFNAQMAGGVASYRLEQLDRFRTRAHNRALNALKALADVRRITLRIGQVNVGARQVNAAIVGADPRGLNDSAA